LSVDVGFDPELIRPMTRALAHRGPDGDGFYFAPGIALGHRRLSIIDLEGGHQPMPSSDGKIHIVFNGLIYNFQSLRQVLEAKGSRFKSRCDTEVILEAWRHYGPDCVDHLSGMFAFVLWDEERQTLFAARDRLGKKPLYYSHLADGSTAFGSELKALKALPGLDRTMDLSAVEDFFAFGYIPDPKSIYAGTRKLPPAHRMIWTRGGDPRIERYWDPDLEPLKISAEEARESLVEKLKEATTGRMVSDVPLGAFLSGGVDSSAIVALMAEASAEPIKTFSIGFGVKEFDETEYANAVAARYKTDHHRSQVDPDDFSLLDRITDIFDEPFGDSSALPTFRVCQEARKGVTVALSGDGGDELFGGYRRYFYHRHEENLRRRIPAGIRKAIFKPLGQIYPKLDRAPRFLRARTTFQELGSDEVWGFFNGVSATADDVRSDIFSDSLKRNLDGYHGVDVLKPHFARAQGDDALARAQYVDFQTWQAGGTLVKVDRTSMANGLEVRAPLLDYRLAEWALRLPAGLKIKGASGKDILKSAMATRLPHDLMYRPKQGFSMPIATWFRGPLREPVEAMVTSGPLVDCGLFNPAALRKLARDHASGRRDHARTLWLLFVFEKFLAGEV
jgi:asparagine synthase (glutamine-hydrolysing)